MRIPSAARLSCRAHLCVSMNIWTILVWICLPRATNATGWTFGVQLQNSGPDLTALPDTISIGDITPQGFPFYSGSLTYRLEGLENTPCTVTAADFGGALLKLTGDKEAIIAFPPHRA